MSKISETSSRIQESNENLLSMKKDLEDIIPEAKASAIKKSVSLLNTMNKLYNGFKSQSTKRFDQARTKIENNPGKSLILVLSAGVLLGYLFKRR